MHVGGEGSSEQLVNGVKSWLCSGAVNLRDGSPGPHPGMSQWLVARCGVLPGRAEEEPGHSATSWEHEKCGVKDGVL